MPTTFIDWRPSALPAACSPDVSVFPASVVGQPSGQPVARTIGRTGLVCELGPTAAARPRPKHVSTVKINNYIGTPAAASALGAVAAGAAMSSLVAMVSGVVRAQQLGDDTVKGADARGIPPRGRRSV